MICIYCQTPTPPAQLLCPTCLAKLSSVVATCTSGHQWLSPTDPAPRTCPSCTQTRDVECQACGLVWNEVKRQGPPKSFCVECRKLSSDQREDLRRERLHLLPRHIEIVG